MTRQFNMQLDEWPADAGPDPVPKKASPEDLFAAQLGAYKSLRFVRQLLFAKQALGRRWAFDFAFVEYKLAVEIDGVAVQRVMVSGKPRLVVLGRHASIEGIRGDHEKMNAAALLGWTVLHFLQTDVKPRHAIDMTLEVLSSKGWRHEP